MKVNMGRCLGGKIAKINTRQIQEPTKPLKLVNSVLKVGLIALLFLCVSLHIAITAWPVVKEDNIVDLLL